MKSDIFWLIGHSSLECIGRSNSLQQKSLSKRWDSLLSKDECSCSICSFNGSALEMKEHYVRHFNCTRCTDCGDVIHLTKTEQHSRLHSAVTYMCPYCPAQLASEDRCVSMTFRMLTPKITLARLVCRNTFTGCTRV